MVEPSNLGRKTRDQRGKPTRFGTRRLGNVPVRPPRPVPSVGSRAGQAPPPKRMTPQQAVTLEAVPRDGARVSEIARATGRTPSAAFSSLNALAQKGLVAKHGRVWQRVDV